VPPSGVVPPEPAVPPSGVVPPDPAVPPSATGPFSLLSQPMPNAKQQLSTKLNPRKERIILYPLEIGIDSERAAIGYHTHRRPNSSRPLCNFKTKKPASLGPRVPLF
jgi:hypothetical protein